MVVADDALLREVRRLAIRDELLAMRLRSELVVPDPARGGPPETARPELPRTVPRRRERHRPR
jgi:hypothetical protein